MNLAAIDHLITAYSRVSFANKTKFQKLKVVLARFYEQGIDYILLKGADLIPRLYGVLGMHPMVDVDLLVHDKDLPAIERILQELGYRTQIDGNPVFVDPDSTLALDIITEVWYVDDQDTIWQRAVQRKFEGIPVKGMGGSDLLLYLIAYCVVHRGVLSESFANDIALLVEKEDVDWNFVIDAASLRSLSGILVGLRRNPHSGPYPHEPGASDPEGTDMARDSREARDGQARRRAWPSALVSDAAGIEQMAMAERSPVPFRDISQISIRPTMEHSSSSDTSLQTVLSALPSPKALH